MMPEIAVKVENISKRYRVGVKTESSDTLVGAITGLLKAPLDNFRRISRLTSFRNTDAPEEVIWAVDDVSFEVRSGEVLGLIGRNGAGKSTLLKILSKITDPTSGQAQIRGRVRALLEVGTGFHVELTGRENVYLNGAILGMKRAEINKKFDEIVDFSGIERYIDTPVKRYSSGMAVRLAFAVAAHLEPDVMLVDEVLAVGDAEFQKKCMGKMDDLAGEGRTIIFVSHNLAVVRRLCQRCVLLENGRVEMIDDSDKVVTHYLSRGESSTGLAVFKPVEGQVAAIHEVGILNGNDEYTPVVPVESGFQVRVNSKITETLEMAEIAIAIYTMDGTSVFASTHTDKYPDGATSTLTPGVYHATVKVPGGFLNVGRYTVNARIFGRAAGQTRLTHAFEISAVTFVVERTGFLASRFHFDRGGVVTPLLDWTLD